MSWQLQEAKAKFSRVVNMAMNEGPQIVTRHGEEVVVVMSMTSYRQLAQSPPSLYELLTQSPFAGAQLEIERDQDETIREVDL